MNQELRDKTLGIS